MLGRKKLLILVAMITLLLHGAGIYYLSKLSLTDGLLSLAKNPFSFPMSGFVEKEQREVSLDEVEETIQDAIEEKLIGTDFDALLSHSEELVSNSSHTSMGGTDLSDDPAILFSNFDETGDSSLDLSSVSLLDLAQVKKGESELSIGDHFTYQLEYAPRRFRAGYVFKISLQPKSDVPFKRMRQNFFFLVDRSNSIPRGRYFLNKKAIAKTLPLISKEDRFNILVFDEKIVRFSQTPAFATEENIARATEFLDNLGHGGYFSTTDIYASLGRVVPRLVSESEINTAILLSDGDTDLSLENQRLLIRNWSEANGGKITLFCLASGTGNNLTLLEMISSFNKGAFIHVSDHKQIEDRLRQLMLSIKNPLGKEIAISALALNKEATPHLLPKSGRLPDLYKNRPYVIYGAINRLEDFTLFLQGKFYDRKFDLRKKISFSTGRFGTLELERKYTSFLVQDYFEQFLKDGNVAHLQAAKQLLSPLNMAVPFLH